VRPRQQCGRIDGALSVACCSVLSVACCPLQGCPLRFQYCCELQREMGPLRPVRRVSALEQAVSHCGRVRWRSARLIGRGRRHHAVHLRAAKPPTTNANATPGSVGLFPHRQRQSRRRTHGGANRVSQRWLWVQRRRDRSAHSECTRTLLQAVLSSAGGRASEACGYLVLAQHHFGSGVDPLVQVPAAEPNEPNRRTHSTAQHSTAQRSAAQRAFTSLAHSVRTQFATRPMAARRGAVRVLATHERKESARLSRHKGGHRREKQAGALDSTSSRIRAAGRWCMCILGAARTRRSAPGS
jgi:hypothetical protein